jgi:tRNA/tmRNA/rRNA uracil-C5-methylase (TrmA/RlmC/RlmD family)
MATVKRKGDLKKMEESKRSVYSGPKAATVFWQGKIERLVWGGLGLGRAEDGRAILLTAPLALFPGEEVKADIVWKARHGEGTVAAWVTRDRRRKPAICKVAATCGGCDLWEAGASLGSLKQLMVEDLFSRQLPNAPAWRWCPAPEEARRHRIQLHWDGKALGFHRRHSHQLVPVTECPASAAVLSSAIPRLEEALHGRILPTKPQRWELATGTPAGTVFATIDSHRTWSLEPDGWHPWEGSLAHHHEGFSLQHKIGGFYQISPGWAAEAFGELLRSWDLRGNTLYDLYGGVGFFSAMLGDRFQHRCLVECDEPAVAWARVNLQALHLPAECIAADAAEWLPENLGQPADLILLDPPRAGLPPELCERLQSARCQTMVLVGCDGASFCRDVKRLSPAWTLEALAALDLFPLTHHVECVGLLKRSGSESC